MIFSRFSIVGAVVVMGGWIVLRWMKNRRGVRQARLANALSSWENEGGAVATPAASPNRVVCAPFQGAPDAKSVLQAGRFSRDN